jgi:hypothetical protein
MRPRITPGNGRRPGKVLAPAIATTVLSAGLGVQTATATTSTAEQVTATRRVDPKPTFHHPNRITNPFVHTGGCAFDGIDKLGTARSSPSSPAPAESTTSSPR